ncbi:MAG: tripartite tricarboxylate transporter substrate binding protein [Burkholderiales bacterium]|jgi:tripartite-type tricarboxylate transporter receptor subunit TctC|nr:tripartite tricarboxylate transporter substrate binding protein [Burkholderiales bacterium]
MSGSNHVRSVCGLLGIALFGVVLGVAAQQNYPVRPVRIIIPSGAGGGTDSTTRMVIPKMDEFLGQRVIAENRPGAGSIVGSEAVARAAPDGYTLLTAISSMTIQPSMQKNLPFDPLRDFAPVSQFVVLPNMLVGHPSLQPKTVKELIAFSKSRPGKLEFGSAGTGSNLHLCMEMFLSMAGLKMVHVPYKSANTAISDLMAGYVPFMVTNMIVGTQQLKAGRVHAYGVTSAARAKIAPNIPTIAEQGVPGYDAVQWYGLMAPAATPKDIVAKLHKGVVFALQDPGVRERFLASGADPVGNTPEEFSAVVRSDISKWAKVVQAAGLKPE